MMEYGYRIYESIIAATQSEVILFFIALFVFLIISQIPYYRGRKADKQHERDREKEILEAFKENASTAASLKATLDSTSASLQATLDSAAASLKATLENIGGKAQSNNERMHASIVRVHTHFDETSTEIISKLGGVSKDIVKINEKLDRIIAMQTESASKLNKS